MSDANGQSDEDDASNDADESRWTNRLPRKQPVADATRVRVQMFPLAADRRTLQKLCDNWFNNQIPPEIAVFRPAMPLVVCMVLSYDDMGSELRWKTGSLSQNELHFMVVLDRYRKNGSRLEFVEHSAMTPYIFVDNATSAVAGRERFGFPKQLCVFRDATDDVVVPWPSYPDRYLSVSTWEPSTTGHQLQPLISIVRDPPKGTEGLDSPVGPVVRRRKQTRDPDAPMRWLQTIIGEIRARSSPGPLGELPGSIEELRYSMQNGFGLSVYNLRQFVEPYYESSAHYQDLVRFRMRPRLIPTPRPLRGEFSFLIDKTDVCPIVDRLGLQVADRQRGARDGYRTVEVLNVMSPMYMQLDVELGSVERLCWRQLWGGWRDDSGAPLTSSPGPAPYNDYLGPSSAVFVEDEGRPPILDIKYLLLPAKADRVREHLRDLIPKESKIQVEPMTVGKYAAVRLLISRSRPRPTNLPQELVWLDGSYASISIPARYTIDGETKEANIMLRDFTDNDFMLQCLRALAPGTTEQANLTTRDDWFTSTQDLSLVTQLDAMSLVRSSTATIKMDHLLDIYALGRAFADQARIQDPAMIALRDAVWPFVRTIPPVLSIGGIASLCDPDAFIERQATLTEITDSHVEDVRDADPSRTYCVKIHPSETYPFANQLGFVHMPKSELATRIQGNDGNQGIVVPVLALAESSVRIKIEQMRTVWRSRFEPDQDAET